MAFFKYWEKTVAGSGFPKKEDGLKSSESGFPKKEMGLKSSGSGFPKKEMDSGDSRSACASDLGWGNTKTLPTTGRIPVVL